MGEQVKEVSISWRGVYNQIKKSIGSKGWRWVVQVNGRKRAVMEVAKGVAEDKEAVMKRVLAEERVKKWLPREVKKVVFVPGKLVNVVG